MPCIPSLLPLLAFAALRQDPPPQDPPPATVVLAGRVVDLRGEGVPVAAVWVTDTAKPDAPLARTVTDAEGYFRVGRVPQRESWTVWATSDGRSLDSDYVRSAAEVARVALHDATTVRGVVRDADGELVPGAIVSASPAGRALSRRQVTATTDADGRFAIDKVPLGLSQLTAWVPGQGLAELRHRVVGDDDLALAATRDATTSFLITIDGLPDEQRPPVTLAWLPYRNGSLTWLPEPYHRPRIDGDEWRAASLPDWRYVVRLSATGYTFEPDQIEVKPGTGPHQLGFVAHALGTTTLDCPAVVRGPDGAPLAGLPFVLRKIGGGARATATSGAEGELTFASPLAAGTEVIVYTTAYDWVVDQEKGEGLTGASDRRFIDDHECVVAPDRTLELRVIRACAVSGRLLRADGRPAQYVRVQLEERRDGRWPEWMTFAYATTDRDGTYRFRGLHHLPDPVRVLVEGAAGTATGEPVAIAAPATEAAVPELRLAPPAVVEGVVRGADGRPSPGVAVWLRDWDFGKNAQKSGSVTETVTDRQGRYRFVGVPVGGAWLEIVLDEDANREQRVVDPFAVEAGTTYTFELTDPGMR